MENNANNIKKPYNANTICQNVKHVARACEKSYFVETRISATAAGNFMRGVGNLHEVFH